MQGESWNMEELKGLEPSNFMQKALSLMQYQAKNNAVYSAWIQAMKVQLDDVHLMEQIPFLPIHFLRQMRFILELNVLVFILKVVVPHRIL